MYVVRAFSFLFRSCTTGFLLHSLMISAWFDYHFHQFFPVVSSDATSQIVEQRGRYKNASLDIYQIFPSSALRSIINHNAIFHLCRDRHAGKIMWNLIIFLQLINEMKKGKVKREGISFSGIWKNSDRRWDVDKSKQQFSIVPASGIGPVSIGYRYVTL